MSYRWSRNTGVSRFTSVTTISLNNNKTAVKWLHLFKCVNSQFLQLNRACR